MGWLTYAVRRTAFAAFAAWVIVSLTFLVVATVKNTDLGALIGGMQRSGASAAEIEAAVEQYQATRGLEGSLLERYVRFMTGVVTLNLGYSAELRTPIAAVLRASIPRTLAYVVPAIAFAYTAGIVAGLVGAYRERAVDWTLRLAAYTAVGIPTFVLGYAVADLAHVHYDWLVRPEWPATPFLSLGRPSLHSTTPWRAVTWHYLLPAAVLSVGLVAALLRHTRNASLAYRSSDASKMLEAKGATETLTARHALWNAALPLLSVSFGELLSVLTLGSFVIETVFHIPGVAAYTMIGVYTRDFYLIVAAGAVYAVIGVVGSLVQDLLYGVLDPTIRAT